MRRLGVIAVAAVLLGVVGVSLAQWQEQPQQGRVEPIYPSRPYSFQTAPPNYDPFQFNWYTGQWDYVPVPYNSVQAPPVVQYAPYSQPPFEPQWNGTPQVSQSAIPQPNLEHPDDSQLWLPPPTTRPAQAAPPKTERFVGRIIALRALNLMGEQRPHLILRLRSAEGKTLTADLGDRLDMAQLPMGALGGKDVAVVGRMGEINDTPVMFAKQISFGSHTIKIQRPPMFPSTRPDGA